MECGAATGLKHPGFDLQTDISGNNKAARIIICEHGLVLATVQQDARVLQNLVSVAPFSSCLQTSSWVLTSFVLCCVSVPSPCPWLVHGNVFLFPSAAKAACSCLDEAVHGLWNRRRCSLNSLYPAQTPVFVVDRRLS